MVFEADYNEAAINIYQTFDLAYNPAPVASITVARGCPYGLAMDKTGTLYVVDNCGGNDVEEYAKGQTMLLKTITSGVSNPLGIAVDAHGRLYVSNYPAAISIYGRGKTKPSKIISGSPMVNPCGLTVDQDGNLFIADYGAGQVFELAVGASGVTALNLQDLAQPLGVGIDRESRDLWVTDGAGDKINVYKPGQTNPTATIAGHGSPYAIGVQNEGKPRQGVVVSDLLTEAVYLYDPKRYTLEATLTNGIDRPTGLLIENP